jgi:hypothetical protein
VTDQQSELDRNPSRPESQRSRAQGAARDSQSSGVSADAIAAGLEFLFSRRHQAAWSLCNPATGESAAWVTAYVLTRLGEIPSHHFNYSQRQNIEDTLNWLMAARTPHGGWSFGAAGSPDDADSTAWAVTALRQFGRSVPEEALELIRRCRHSDGGFATHPDSANNNDISRISATDVTAIAVRALASIDSASSEFLASHLRTNTERRPCRVTSTFFVSSTLLDWEPGMAPWSIVNAVRKLVRQQEGEEAWEQALLLRCRMRLGLQSAWALAASLRRLQRPDGSWPGSAHLAPLIFVSADGSAPHPDGPPFDGQVDQPHFDMQGILATVTALSALAMCDLQPGLYFGSDLPFRRL